MVRAWSALPEQDAKKISQVGLLQPKRPVAWMHESKRLAIGGPQPQDRYSKWRIPGLRKELEQARFISEVTALGTILSKLKEKQKTPRIDQPLLIPPSWQ